MRWEVSGVCNRNCLYCQARGIRGQPGLSGRELERLLENLAWEQLAGVVLLGGEPTLHPDFGKICRLLSRAGVAVTVNTNCRWQDVQEVYGLIEEGAVASLALSLDSHDPELNDVTRGRGAFQDVTGKLDRLAKMRREGLLEALSLGCVVTRVNKDALAPYLAWADSQGFDSVVFYKMKTGSMPRGAVTRLEPSLAELHAAVDQLFASAPTELDIHVSLPFIGNPLAERLARRHGRALVEPTNMGCLAATSEAFISHEGMVMPCEAAFSGISAVQQDCRSLVRHGLQEIWESRLFSNFRAWRMEAEHSDELCLCCAKRGLCSPCPLRGQGLTLQMCRQAASVA